MKDDEEPKVWITFIKLVVDECHAGSYKQGQSPRYHAIDVARERAGFGRDGFGTPGKSVARGRIRDTQ